MVQMQDEYDVFSDKVIIDRPTHNSKSKEEYMSVSGITCKIVWDFTIEKWQREDCFSTTNRSLNYKERGFKQLSSDGSRL